MKKIFGLLLIVLFASCGAGDKTAFVDIDKVFNEFELTKQKKAEYENTLNKRKEITDKEKLRLQQIAGKLEAQKSPDKKEVEKFQIDREMLRQKMQADEEQNRAMDDQYTSEIWKQLNQYMQDFQKDNGYTYVFIKSDIIGDESKDVTKEALEFVNKKFKGDK